MSYAARADAILSAFSSRIEGAGIAMPQMCAAAWMRLHTPLRQVGGAASVGRRRVLQVLLCCLFGACHHCQSTFCRSYQSLLDAAHAAQAPHPAVPWHIVRAALLQACWF
jgi:hypothetical protein